MPLTPPRHVGRHRGENLHRHRAPRASFAAALPSTHLAAVLPLSDKHGQIALTATLGAALVVGVAGGSAAAAATHHASEALPAAESNPSVAPSTDTGREPTATPWSPPALPLRAAADRVQPKARPGMAAAAARAAWVNPDPTATVTSCFGPRWGRMHEGVDLAAPNGSPIVAAGAGVVVRAGVAEGYGNAVLIDHGNGYLTHYGHLSLITVKVGQHVAAGQQIGKEGETGDATGPHLHFEVHQGYYQHPIEPTRWMHEHGVDIPGCVPLT
ncbi:M23 family metallopeptidase [Actinoplanes sp. KI2]|uniref:M23 family metallopeptidase n=1 Tax=Actinoplanes sp. KI2 TaxID=2983315 RepID=UPI0021D5AED2|nr:M23 family metallopeptidase [Actinoplanes sp. KI2]MCU7730231.1 M23 family metallopeptidase [Actinoplanes sp. KI2]